MKPRNPKMTKGMAFAGCSFTWGQCLWYYSNLSSLVVQEYNKYDSSYVNFTHKAFTEANRYPRLVANHFNTYELCQPFNGGSNSTILDYWKDYAFSDDSNINQQRITNRNIRGPVYDIRDIDCFVLQFTAWPRSDITFEHRGKVYGPMQRWSLFTDHESLFHEYLEDNNISVDRFFSDSKKNDVNMIKSFLLGLQKKGIRVFTLCWPHDLVQYILEDKWLSDNFIKIQYDGKEFTDIETLIKEYPEMSIMGDNDFFIEPPKDGHPSLKCHRVIADSIIRFIEQRA